MKRAHAQTLLEFVSLTLGVIRKECVVESLNVVGISEDHLRDAVVALWREATEEERPRRRALARKPVER